MTLRGFLPQWDLVCHRNYLAELSQSLYLAVALIADVVCSWLVDRAGRKKMHIIGESALRSAPLCREPG